MSCRVFKNNHHNFEFENNNNSHNKFKIFNSNNKYNNSNQNNSEKRNYFSTPTLITPLTVASSRSNSDYFIHKNKKLFDDIIDSQNTIEIRVVPSNISTIDQIHSANSGTHYSSN
ncbi:hypothetical protein ACTFIZ_009067 [Dictyostelium cf. discoideum]